MIFQRLLAQWIFASCQTSNISCPLEGNTIVDHSDVVGASPVSFAPTTSSFSTEHLASMLWARTTARQDEQHLIFGIWFAYIDSIVFHKTPNYNI